jgi:hypothetical protein
MTTQETWRHRLRRLDLRFAAVMFAFAPEHEKQARMDDLCQAAMVFSGK